MVNIINEDFKELRYKIALDIYKLFQKKDYEIPHKANMYKTLALYVSSLNNKYISTDYIESLFDYGFKDVLDMDFIEKFNMGKVEVNGFIRCIEKNKQKAEKALEKSISNESLRKIDLFDDDLTRNNRIIEALLKVFRERQNRFNHIRFINLLVQSNDLTGANLFGIYQYIENQFSEKFALEVARELEGEVKLTSNIPKFKIELKDIEKEVLKKGKPISTKNVIEKTILILDIFRKKPYLGGEEFLRNLSYFISPLCNGYVKESFIYFVIQKLEELNVFELRRINNFGHRQYSIFDIYNNPYGDDKIGKYIEKNIETIISYIDEQYIGSPYKKEVINEPIFKVFKYLHFVNSYRGHKYSPIDLYEEIQELIELNNPFIPEQSYTFMRVVFNITNSYLITKEILKFYRKAYKKCNPYKELNYKRKKQEIFEGIETRKNLLKLYKTTKKNWHTMMKIIEIDKKYMDSYIELLKGEIKKIDSELDIYEYMSHSKYYDDDTKGLVLSVNFYNNTSKHKKNINEFLYSKGFEVDEKEKYQLYTFHKLQVNKTIVYDRHNANYYPVKVFLEDNNIDVHYSNMKEHIFQCTMKKDIYDRIKRNPVWVEDDRGLIEIDLDEIN